MFFYKPKFWEHKNSIISYLLYPISLIIIFINKIKKFKTAKKFNIPIICVGNIYLGGTGKTPISSEIFDIVKESNKKPAFVKKFYPYLKDEISLLEMKGEVFSNKKRIDSIINLQNKNYNVAILDDGYQDFSFIKNYSIVCFNQEKWIGNGRVIPSGPLRESFSNINRANCIAINGVKREEIENEILKYNGKIDIVYFEYELDIPDNLKFKNVIAFAGIANPRNFFNLLKKKNINLKDTFNFPDHYNYNDNDIRNLKQRSYNTNSVLLTTEKDYLRIKEEDRKDINFLKLKVVFENKNKFKSLIKKVI